MGKWTIEDTLIMAGDTCVARVFKTYHPEELQEANAERIVKAVNCHDDLVEALRGIMETLESCGSEHNDVRVASPLPDILPAIYRRMTLSYLLSWAFVLFLW